MSGPSAKGSAARSRFSRTSCFPNSSMSMKLGRNPASRAHWYTRIAVARSSSNGRSSVALCAVTTERKPFLVASRCRAPKAETNAGSRQLNCPLPGGSCRCVRGSKNQDRCAAPDSSITVGVSALYSASLGGASPSQSRSSRPQRSLWRVRHECLTAGHNSSGMPNSRRRSLDSTTSATASRHIECSSNAARSIIPIPCALTLYAASSFQ
mmetsp:Transcript_10074/g.22964  ORF Transcript_10074/g.22964 Transcript_10074/m.22964 type:complete len:210 (+) Transcript_10074:1327-1956(+)